MTTKIANENALAGAAGEREAIVESKGGPRTEGGKRRSSKNEIKHGLFSSATLIEGESEREFESLLGGFNEAFQPIGLLEAFLVDKLASDAWRLRRVLVAERLAAERNDISLTLEWDKKEPLSPDSMFRCEAARERSFYRTWDQLERLQRMRLGHAVAPPINVQISG
jgi:hypothetical protein